MNVSNQYVFLTYVSAESNVFPDVIDENIQNSSIQQTLM